MIKRLLAILAASIVVVRLSGAETVTVSQVIAAPAIFHGKTIQVRGVFWTDGEGSLLLETATDNLNLDRAIAISGDRAKLDKDPTYQKLKSVRLRGIQQYRKEHPKAGWVIYQVDVIFEGRFEDAASLPFKSGTEGEDYQVINPYRGCRWKLDLIRVVSFDAGEPVANKPPEATPGQRPSETPSPTSGAPQL